MFYTCMKVTRQEVFLYKDRIHRDSVSEQVWHGKDVSLLTDCGRWARAFILHIRFANSDDPLMNEKI